MGAYPPPRRELGGVRQARRESGLSARREASDRLVRDQLDQQQFARAEQLSIISSAGEELADEKRLQRAMSCGVVLSVLEDIRARAKKDSCCCTRQKRLSSRRINANQSPRSLTTRRMNKQKK